MGTYFSEIQISEFQQLQLKENAFENVSKWWPFRLGGGVKVCVCVCGGGGGGGLK